MLPRYPLLHIHGTADSVIRYEGDASELSENGGEPAFHAGAQDMVMRWSQRAGCDWPEPFEPYANLDLDRSVSGSENPGIPLGIGLRRRHRHRALEGCGQQPRAQTMAMPLWMLW